MIRYHSHRERRSRLQEQENRRFLKQTVLIILGVVIFLAAIILFGLPALVKLAIFLGDLRSSATPIENTDTIPPATPQLDTLPDATSSAAINLSGYSEPEAQIRLYKNGGQLTTVVVSQEGSFYIPDISLTPGLNRFYAIALDSAGNESLQSSTQTVIYDSDAPTLTLDKPAEGQSFFGLNEQTLSLEGKTDPGVTVSLNDHFLVVDSDGKFSGRYQLQNGDNPLVFKAVDAAGNQTTTTLTVKFSP